MVGAIIVALLGMALKRYTLNVKNPIISGRNLLLVTAHPGVFCLGNA